MKKIWLGVIVLLVIAAVFIVIQTKKEPREIKIGAILPLTGGAGKYGEDAKAGIELAVQEINNLGGIKGKLIKVLYEDDQTNPQQTVSGFRKLIAVDKVSIVIGGMTSSSALAVAPIAEQNKIILFSPSASTAKLSNQGDYIFRNELSDSFGAYAQAELTWNKLKIKKVAIIYINNDYGIGVKDTFIKTFKDYGGEIIDVESFEADSTEFKTQLSLIKQKDPEALFIIAYKEASIILKQIKELGIKSKLLSTPLFEDRDILDKSGALAEGVIYTYYGGFNLHSIDENVISFVNKYKIKNNREPGYYSPLAYDAMNIIILAIEKSGTTTSEAIKNELYKIRDFPGVTGKTTFDSNGDVNKPVILKRIKNGEFVIYADNQ